ncbi:hypothetical protein [Thermococcus pacificus]|uniref:Uncharacterized protein n=1 Tax=Thermococcus pacificus TaxID=71998 RepID=A0A218P8U2_9EURY|nr:hypothetical protein [Thermococcus pacificus]ASJ07188.1 hypothetical protein A3L08_07575 [Thermococcus pacificus]
MVIVEKLLSPAYTVTVLNLKKFEPKDLLEGFKRRGFHIWKSLSGLDIELEIESFIASTYGKYVYVLKFKEETYLARGKEKVLRKEWKGPKTYLVRHVAGLKRLLLQELSLKAKLSLLLPQWILWSMVGVYALSWLKEDVLMSFLLTIFGFALNDIVKAVDYLILGYCNA